MILVLHDHPMMPGRTQRPNWASIAILKRSDPKHAGVADGGEWTPGRRRSVHENRSPFRRASTLQMGSNVIARVLHALVWLSFHHHPDLPEPKPTRAELQSRPEQPHPSASRTQSRSRRPLARCSQCPSFRLGNRTFEAFCSNADAKSFKRAASDAWSPSSVAACVDLCVPTLKQTASNMQLAVFEVRARLLQASSFLLQR